MLLHPVWILLIVLLISITTMFILLAIVQSGVERVGPPPQIVEGAILPILFPFTLAGLAGRMRRHTTPKGQGIFWIIVSVVIVIMLVALIIGLLTAFRDPGAGTEVGIIERIGEIFG